MLCATIILMLSTPLFFAVMKHSYTEDLDELVQYRSDDFIKNRASSFKLSDIAAWNRFNEDMHILSKNTKLPKGEITQLPFYNNAEREMIEYRVLLRDIKIQGHPFILFTKVSLIETEDLLKTLLYQYMLIMGALFISLTLILRVISKRLWSPFNDTLRLIEQFTLDEGKVPPFGDTGINEFFQLNQKLTHLIENNIRIYKLQKEFTENASHELQTPLAVFQTKLDLLLQQENLTEAQANIIQSLYDVSVRLTRLNKNLLLLTKIENRQFKEIQPLSVLELLQKQIPYFSEQISMNGLTLQTEIDASDLIVDANRVLLESLVNNLIVNAIRHNISDGIIFIGLKGRKLIIRNTGVESELNKNEMFHRFGRPSERVKGNGLGLSIIYQICLFHGWKVSYDYQNKMHEFTVTF